MGAEGGGTGDEVARHAVDHASRIIGTFLDALAPDPRRGPAAAPVAGDGPGGEPGIGQVRAEMARSLDRVVDLLRRTFDAYGELLETSAAPGGVTAGGGDGSDGPGPGELLLEGTGGDPALAGTLFVHNRSGAAIGPVDVVVTDLAAHDGTVIPAGRVSLDPKPLGKVADGATARVAVVVDTTGVPPGSYHGHALTAETALPVRVVLGPR